MALFLSNVVIAGPKDVKMSILIERATDQSMTLSVKSSQSGFMRVLIQNSGGSLSFRGDLIPVKANQYSEVTEDKKPLVLPAPADGQGGSGDTVGAMYFKNAGESKAMAAKIERGGLSAEEVVKLGGAVTKAN